MPRTGSIGSKVGPAVINRCFPARVLVWNDAIISVSNCAGSNILPMPVSPQAWSPAAGPRTSIPSALIWATLRCVARFCHISTFIAGAISNGMCAGLATHNVDSKSSQAPCASLNMKSVLQGAITMAFASRVRSMCGMLLSIRASHWSVNTVLPESACIVTGVMNCVAACVITTCTVAPAFPKARVSSATL